MDFTNEPYVRLFTRDTLTWKRFNWQAKAVLPLLLRKLDRAGTMDLDGMDLSGAIAVAIELPPEVVDEAVPCLLKLGTIAVHGDTLIAPRFLEAQECIKSDKLRAKEYRERKRSQTMAEPSQNVTNRHEENETSRPVTLGLTLPSEPSDPEREIARAREAPEVERRNSEPVESFVPARRPLPEPPPDRPALPPPRKSDRARVHELLAEALGRTVDQLAPDLVSADLVARAARAETGEDEPAFEAAVRRMLAAWQADPHPRAKKHSLANMVMHLTKYTAPTRHVVKPARPVPVRVPHPYLPNATTTPEDRDRILAELDRMTEMGNALEMAANG